MKEHKKAVRNVDLISVARGKNYYRMVNVKNVSHMKACLKMENNVRD